jgi:hypothetical protein
MKRYIYILIIVIVVAALVVLGLYLWKSGSLSIPGASTGTGATGGSLPPAGTQGSNGTGTSGGQTSSSSGPESGAGGNGSAIVAGSFGPLSNDPVLNYFVEPNNVVLALEPNGVVAQIANGQTSYLSSSTATNVISGAFSFDGKKALLNFGDPNSPQTAVFDVTSGQWTALPQGMQSPQWSPSDYRIAYLANAGTGMETLATINAAAPKSGQTSLITLHVQDLTLQWVGKTQFALSDKPSDVAAGSALLFDSANQSIAMIANSVMGLESTWSGAAAPNMPLEALLSFSPGSGLGNGLELVDGAGDILQNLTIQTLPTKCGFAIATSTDATASTTSNSYLALYCGIPRDTSTFDAANLPDDYNQMALFTSDDIERINTQTGEIDTLWNDSAENVDVSTMKALGSEIFFIDRYTNKLYALTLQEN